MAWRLTGGNGIMGAPFHLQFLDYGDIVLPTPKQWQQDIKKTLGQSSSLDEINEINKQLHKLYEADTAKFRQQALEDLIYQCQLISNKLSLKREYPEFLAKLSQLQAMALCLLKVIHNVDSKDQLWHLYPRLKPAQPKANKDDLNLSDQDDAYDEGYSSMDDSLECLRSGDNTGDKNLVTKASDYKLHDITSWEKQVELARSEKRDYQNSSEVNALIHKIEQELQGFYQAPSLAQQVDHLNHLVDEGILLRGQHYKAMGRSASTIGMLPFGDDIREHLIDPAQQLIKEAGLLPLCQDFRKVEQPYFKRELHFDDKQRLSYQIFPDSYYGGRFLQIGKNSHGQLAVYPYYRRGDTPWEKDGQSAVTVDSQGHWFAGTTQGGSVHHSSYVGGKPVRFAGVASFSYEKRLPWWRRLWHRLCQLLGASRSVDDSLPAGVMIGLGDQSGHYRPDEKTTRHFINDYLTKKNLHGHLKTITLIPKHGKRTEHSTHIQKPIAEFLGSSRQCQESEHRQALSLAPMSPSSWLSLSKLGLLSRRNRNLRAIDRHHQALYASVQRSLDQKQREYVDLSIECLHDRIKHYNQQYPTSRRLEALTSLQASWHDYLHATDHSNAKALLDSSVAWPATAKGEPNSVSPSPFENTVREKHDSIEAKLSQIAHIFFGELIAASVENSQSALTSVRDLTPSQRQEAITRAKNSIRAKVALIRQPYKSLEQAIDNTLSNLVCLMVNMVKREDKYRDGLSNDLASARSNDSIHQEIEAFNRLLNNMSITAVKSQYQKHFRQLKPLAQSLVALYQKMDALAESMNNVVELPGTADNILSQWHEIISRDGNDLATLQQFDKKVELLFRSIYPDLKVENCEVNASFQLDPIALEHCGKILEKIKEISTYIATGSDANRLLISLANTRTLGESSTQKAAKKYFNLKWQESLSRSLSGLATTLEAVCGVKSDTAPKLASLFPGQEHNNNDQTISSSKSTWLSYFEGGRCHHDCGEYQMTRTVATVH